MSAKIRKGDTVEVTVGKNKGARGTVLRIDSAKGRAIVEGVNMVKRHLRPSRQYGRGGIIEREASIHLSNVALVHNAERTRVGFRERGGKRVRWSKRHGEAIDE